MTQEKSTGSSKPFKRYLYLNKFTEYQQENDARVHKLEKKTNRIMTYLIIIALAMLAIAICL